MKTPNLDRIIEVYVPVEGDSFNEYIEQMKRDVLGPIRRLQQEEAIRWFCFLLHPAGSFKDRENMKESWGYFHVRMEPDEALDTFTFIKTLPEFFLDPKPVALKEISEIRMENLTEENWAQAWRMVGECSEWVFSLLETNQLITSRQLFKFMHFITNPLMTGAKCLYLPDGFVTF